MAKKFFKDGEVVKLTNQHGEDFDVKIIRKCCDIYGEFQWYYVVEPIGFVGFQREVKCELCYK